jgi:hypothetical protein
MAMKVQGNHDRRSKTPHEMLGMRRVEYPSKSLSCEIISRVDNDGDIPEPHMALLLPILNGKELHVNEPRMLGGLHPIHLHPIDHPHGGDVLAVDGGFGLFITNPLRTSETHSPTLAVGTVATNLALVKVVAMVDWDLTCQATMPRASTKILPCCGAGLVEIISVSQVDMANQLKEGRGLRHRCVNIRNRG